MLEQSFGNKLAEARIYINEPYSVVLKVKGDGEIHINKFEAEQLVHYLTACIARLQEEEDDGLFSEPLQSGL